MSIKQALLSAGYLPGESKFLVKTLQDAGYAIAPVEPTEAMLNGARDWSCKKNGQGVGTIKRRAAIRRC